MDYGIRAHSPIVAMALVGLTTLVADPPFSLAAARVVAIIIPCRHRLASARCPFIIGQYESREPAHRARQRVGWLTVGDGSTAAANAQKAVAACTLVAIFKKPSVYPK